MGTVGNISPANPRRDPSWLQPAPLQHFPWAPWPWFLTQAAAAEQQTAPWQPCPAWASGMPQAQAVLAVRDLPAGLAAAADAGAALGRHIRHSSP